MRPHTLAPICVVAAAAVVLLATGCGGSPSTSTAATAPSGAVAFARCMRSHGVPNWPDPDSTGGFDKQTLLQLRLNFTQVRALEQGPCNHMLPNGGFGPQRQDTVQQRRTRVTAALAFARCMRARGFPGFPDPTNQGQLTPEMVTAAGIDLHQPQLLSAGLACAPLTHGLITRAAVQRAVNGG